MFHLFLEGVRKLHIIVVDEAKMVIARRQIAVIHIIT